MLPRPCAAGTNGQGGSQDGGAVPWRGRAGRLAQWMRRRHRPGQGRCLHAGGEGGATAHARGALADAWGQRGGPDRCLLYTSDAADDM
eukprot:318062-Alexandrium_andersonii.AAC.1